MRFPSGLRDIYSNPQSLPPRCTNLRPATASHTLADPSGYSEARNRPPALQESCHVPRNCAGIECSSSPLATLRISIVPLPYLAAAIRSPAGLQAPILTPSSERTTRPDSSSVTRTGCPHNKRRPSGLKAACDSRLADQPATLRPLAVSQILSSVESMKLQTATSRWPSGCQPRSNTRPGGATSEESSFPARQFQIRIVEVPTSTRTGSFSKVLISPSPSPAASFVLSGLQAMACTVAPLPMSDPTGQELIKQRAQRVEVASRVDVLIV